jgi:hypothetical protein
MVLAAENLQGGGSQPTSCRSGTRLEWLETSLSCQTEFILSLLGTGPVRLDQFSVHVQTQSTLKRGALEPKEVRQMVVVQVARGLVLPVLVLSWFPERS